MTMRRIDLQPLEPFTSDFIDRTGAFNPGALEAATAIIEQVRRDGDAALRALTEKFDGVAIENFRVPGEAIDAAMAEVDPDTLEALKHAAAQIRDFHERQRQQSSQDFHRPSPAHSLSAAMASSPSISPVSMNPKLLYSFLAF